MRGVRSMSDYLPVLITGVVTGSIYAIVALGLTLTYSTSGVFNFAQGAIAAAAAFVFYKLHISVGLPWPLAFVIVLVAFGLIGGFLLELMARGLSDVPVVQRIVATVGLLIAIQGCLSVMFGSVTYRLPEFLGTDVHHVSGAYFSTSDIVKVIVALVLALGLGVYLRSTRTGKAMRAVVDDPALLDMVGTNPARVRRAAWIIGCSFAALCGMLIAPLLNVDAILLTLLVVHAFGACAIGRFSSLPMTYLGALIVGVAEQVVQKHTAAHAALAQIYPATSFFILLAVLIFMPKGKLRELGQIVRQRPSRTSEVPVGVRRAGVAVGGLLLLLAPFIVDATRLSTATAAIAGVAVYLSLTVLVRMSGQVSLCQISLQGVGAAMFAHAVSNGGLGVFNLGLPWLVAVIAAGLFTIPFGVAVAVPAIRLSGTFLALATLGFGILLQQAGFGFGFFFGSDGSVPTPRPQWAEGPWAFYYTVLAVVVVCAALVKLVDNARLGRLLRALGDSPRALSTLGTSATAVRTLAFALSAFLAGVSGALVGGVGERSNATSFQTLAGLGLVAILAVATSVGGSGLIVPAFLAAIAFTFLPSYATQSNPNATYAFQMLFGLAAIAVALLSNGRWSTIFADLSAKDAHRTETSPVRERYQEYTPAGPARTAPLGWRRT